MRQTQHHRLELVYSRLLQLSVSAASSVDQKLKAAAQIVNVSPRISRLFGLDAPERIELAANMDQMLEVVRSQVSEDEYEQILEALARRDSGGEAREAPGGEAAEGSPLN